MNDWHAGYTSETAYTYGYYTELNPLRVQLILLSYGYIPPKISTACELGFGQGVTVNIHAAASGVRWYGTDFSPAQTAFAQGLAEASDNGALLSEQSFRDFCSRSDLPDFDFIALHGIWSWISPENQGYIVDFLARKLKPGGVLYVSYNTQAGWAAIAPIRDLLEQHSRVMSAPGQDIRVRVSSAMSFVSRMMDTNPRYLAANPSINVRLKQFGELDPNYLAHEFFNHYWQPESFSGIKPVLSAAKLDFAGSAAFSDHVDVLNLSQEQVVFLGQIPDPTFRENTRDFMINRQFRQDYWVKGGRQLNGHEQAVALRALRIMLVVPRKLIGMTVTGVTGECNLDPDAYDPLFDLMQDLQPHSIGELEQGLQGKVHDLGALLQMLLILAHKSCVSLVQDDAAIALARPHTDKLNRHLLNQALGRNDIAALASPVTGGGVGVLHLQQLFLLGRMHGHQGTPELAMFVWKAFQPLKQSMMRDGVMLTSQEENLAEIGLHAESFHDTVLPMLQRLGVVD